MPKRIAILGAGPSGFAPLRAFQSAQTKGDEIPEIVCFEKQSDWGGLWNYTWRTGLDEYGEPVHGAMYRYLWSNGPSEGLEFADYSFEEHFGKQIASYPPRVVLFDYIQGRVQKAGVRDLIRFEMAVRWVKKDGAKSITVSHRTAAMGYDWPDNWSEVPLLTHVDGTTAHFKDDTSKDIDAVILCTGYRHHFPFLPDEAVMKADVADRIAREDDYDAIWYQGDYIKELIAETDYPTFDVGGACKAFNEWKGHEKKNIMTFRDNGYKSVITGTMAPKHHTPWKDALDDCLEVYLQN